MKYIIIVLILFGCSRGNGVKNSNEVPSEDVYQNAKKIGEIRFAGVYKIKVDSVEYVALICSYGVAIVKHSK